MGQDKRGQLSGEKAETDMSDNTNLADSNIEPSMEDILSSIRKVIAEDLVNEQAADENKANNNADPDIADFSADDNVALSDDTDLPELELDTVNDASIDTSEDVPQETSMDDMLELVTLEDDLVVAEELELEEIVIETTPFETEDWRNQDSNKDENDILDPDLHLDTDQGLTEIENKAIQSTVEETMGAEITTLAQQLSTEDVILTNIEDNIENDTKIAPTFVTPVTPDEDMNLVKSLLAGLMDEPPSEIDSVLVSETADPDFANKAVFADEAVHNLEDQDIIISEPHGRSDIIDLAVIDDTLVELQSSLDTNEIFDQAKPEQKPEQENLLENAPVNTPKNTLAEIVREIGALNELSVEVIPNPDDIVTLEAPDLVSKLALTSGVAVSAPTLVMSSQDTTTDDKPEPIPPHTSTQEDKAMATPMKNDMLSGSDTQADTSNAFASLTSAVQEQTQIEENGPYIGELVKEALKPMLQDWLDKNLKTMVQRAVTKEIKRISSSK